MFIAPWGSWAYSYRIRLPAHMSLVRSTEYEPPGASRNIESPEYEHPRMSLQGSFGMETWGAPKFTAIPSQASTPHVQNGALRLHSAMGGIYFPKRTNSTLHNPFCTNFFSAYVFLGPWLYNTCFFKNKSFFEGGFMILFFPLGSASVKGFFLHVFFSKFLIFDVLQNMFVPCNVSLLFVFGCSSAWRDCAWVVNCRDFWAWKWL